MTRKKHLKRRVRGRMKKTGESYTAARRHVTATAGRNHSTGKTPDLKRTTGMSNAAVRKSTGRDWEEWFSILDGVGADKMAHRDIACYLYENHEISGWWRQMVTVGYERARGMRRPHERPDGFEISKSKTVAVPLSRLYQAFSDPSLRRRWLSEEIEVRKETRNKSMRVTWSDGRTSLSINFYSRGNARSQVSLQHGKLADAGEAEEKKAFWADRLTKLKELLEGVAD